MPLDLRRVDGIATLAADTSPLGGDELLDRSPEGLVADSVRPGQPLLVDLRRIPLPNSNLLGYLSRIKRILSRQGSRMVLLATAPDAIRLFEILRLDGTFCIVHSRERALRACRLELEVASEATR